MTIFTFIVYGSFSTIFSSRYHKFMHDSLQNRNKLTLNPTSKASQTAREPNVGAWLDVLPYLLERVAACDVICSGGDRTFGLDYRRSVIFSIAESVWRPECAVRIASVLENADLSAEEREKVVEKLGGCLEQASLTDLPALAQCLLRFESPASTGLCHGPNLLFKLADIFRDKCGRAKQPSDRLSRKFS
jgi:hypothetical protein